MVSRSAIYCAYTLVRDAIRNCFCEPRTSLRCQRIGRLNYWSGRKTRSSKFLAPVHLAWVSSWRCRFYSDSFRVARDPRVRFAAARRLLATPKFLLRPLSQSPSYFLLGVDHCERGAWLVHRYSLCEICPCHIDPRSRTGILSSTS